MVDAMHCSKVEQDPNIQYGEPVMALPPDAVDQNFTRVTEFYDPN